MNKILGVLGALLLGSATLSAASFTNTGSASWFCDWSGNDFRPKIPEQASGTTFNNFDCPPGYVATGSGSASVDNLSANAFLSGRSTAPFTTVSLQSKFTDSLMPTGGTGPGIVEFTLTYSFSGFRDVAGANGGADLFFNGVLAENIQRLFCKRPGVDGCPFSGPLVITVIIDEPITYGIPFSYQVDDSLSALGGPGVLAVGNQTTVSALLMTGGTLAEVPEPGTLLLSVIGSLAFLFLIRLAEKRH